MRLWNFVLLLVICHVQCETVNTKANIKVLTWNILAPLWVDEASLKQLGTVDMRLLEENMRTKLVIRRILDTDPDIICLQEVQEDVFSTIRDAIQTRYKPVAFAPNVNGYWNSSKWIPEGKEYVKNGVATFYRKTRLFLQSFTHLPTSENGSIALLSVFRPFRRSFVHVAKGKNKGNPIVNLNSHLESGFTGQEALARVKMVNVIHGHIVKVLEDLKEFNPVIIWGGDFNTFGEFPGMKAIKALGYTNAVEATSNVHHTVIYPVPVPLPGNPQGSSIDNIVIKESHNKDGKISFLSTKLPDISSSEQSKKNYKQTVIQILLSEIAQNRLTGRAQMMNYLLQSKDFFNLYMINSDPNKYDSIFNRALRIGSDHLPLTVTMSVEM